MAAHITGARQAVAEVFNEIGRRTGHEAVVVQPQRARRQPGHHVQPGVEFVLAGHVRGVGIQKSRAQRIVAAEGVEGILHVVRPGADAHPAGQQLLDPGAAARRRSQTPAHEHQVA